MEAELPGVGPGYEEITTIIEEADCGFAVDTAETEAIVDAIASLLKDPKKATDMGMRGKEALELTYDYR